MTLRCLRVPILICLALVSLCSSAAADDGFVPTDQVPQVQAFMGLAEATWQGRNPCAGIEQVKVDDLDSSTAGLAYVDGSCRFEVSSHTLTSDPSELCVTVVHEIGHLAGEDHSPDPYAVMNAVPYPWWPPCAVASGEEITAAHIAINITSFEAYRSCALMGSGPVVSCRGRVRGLNGWRPATFQVFPVGERWAVRRLPSL